MVEPFQNKPQICFKVLASEVLNVKSRSYQIVKKISFASSPVHLAGRTALHLFITQYHLHHLLHHHLLFHHMLLHHILLILILFRIHFLLAKSATRFLSSLAFGSESELL